MSDHLAAPNDLSSKEFDEYVLTFTRLASLGLLSSAILHDVRNALTILSGNIQILQMKGNSATAEEMLQRLERMIPQIKRMENTIGRVESFSLRAKGIAQTISPDALIDNALLTLAYLPDGANLTVNRDYNRQNKHLFGDPSLLEFIVLELFRQIHSQYRDSSIRIESSDRHPYWELRLGIASNQETQSNKQSADSPGIRISQLAANKADGTLNSFDEAGWSGWRLLLPWSIEASNYAEN